MLDGTREYGEQGREDWAVRIACVVHAGDTRGRGSRAAGEGSDVRYMGPPCAYAVRAPGALRIAVSRAAAQDRSAAGT